MKPSRFFLPVLILIIFSFCPFLPQKWLPEPTRPEVTPTNTTTLNLPTPTIAIETLTPTLPEVLASPTIETLIPDDLEMITRENLHNLEVLGEISYAQIQPNHIIYFLRFSNDGTKLVVISENWDTRQDSLVVWNLITNTQVLKIEDPPYTLWHASFSPDDQQLWVSHEEMINVYDLQEGKLEESLNFPINDGGEVIFSPNGKFIVTGVYHGDPDTSTIKIFPFGNPEPFHTEEMAYMILSFHISPDSRIVVGTSSRIGASLKKVWDLETGALLTTLINYDSGPVFSSSSKLAAFVKSDNISVFSTDSWILKSTFRNGKSESPNLPRFFLGMDEILAISDNNDLTFNDAKTGEELHRLAKEGAIVDFSPNFNLILTYQNLGNIRLWGVRP